MPVRPLPDYQRWVIDQLTRWPDTASIARSPVDVWECRQGVWHTNADCGSRLLARSRRSAVTLEQLGVSDRLCVDCAWDKEMPAEHRDIDLIGYLAHFAATRHGDAGNPNQIWRHAQDQLDVAQQLDELHSLSRVAADLAARIATQFREAATQRLDWLRSPEGLQVGLDHVQARVPACEEVDDTPCLVAVHCYAEPTFGGGLLHQFSLRTYADGAVMVLAPRHVADYMRERDGGQVMGIVECDGVPDEMIEAAAALWEPRGEGPMGSIRVALDTAIAVCA